MIFTLLACAPRDADVGSVLLVPDDVRVDWTDALADDEDQGGNLSWLAVEVRDPDGAPADGVRVDVTSGWRGAWLAAADTLTPDDGGTCDAPCEVWTDEDGRPWDVRPTANSWALWDSPPGHGWVSGATDSDGVFAFTVFLDTLPDSGAAAPIYVTIADQTRSFALSGRDGVVDSAEEPS